MKDYAPTIMLFTIGIHFRKGGSCGGEGRRVVLGGCKPIIKSNVFFFFVVFLFFCFFLNGEGPVRAGVNLELKVGGGVGHADVNQH